MASKSIAKTRDITIAAKVSDLALENLQRYAAAEGRTKSNAVNRILEDLPRLTRSDASQSSAGGK